MLKLWGGIFDIDRKLQLIKEEEALTHAADFWNDPKKAEIVLKGINQKKKWTQPYIELSSSIDDLAVLFEDRKSVV